MPSATTNDPQAMVDILSTQDYPLIYEEQRISSSHSETDFEPPSLREKGIPRRPGEVYEDREHYPSNEELITLRRISGLVPWTAYTVAIVELCERFSYYGTIAVCKNNCLTQLGEIL
jgi:hypothetical protein